jgi:paraquat-inducible protein A
MLAAALTAAAGLTVANAFPLLTLASGGLHTEATFWHALAVSYQRDLPLVALVLGATLFVAPILEVLLMLWVLVPLRAGTRPLAFVPVMRALTVLRPWRMVEVFLLGVIVAIVKLTNIATATPGWGLFGVATATIALAALGTVDRDALWRRAREAA